MDFSREFTFANLKKSKFSREFNFADCQKSNFSREFTFAISKKTKFWAKDFGIFLESAEINQNIFYDDFIFFSLKSI